LGAARRRSGVRGTWKARDERKEGQVTGLAVGGEAEWWRAVLDGAGDVWQWCSECVERWAVA
jgi:hypothetical protein